MQRSAGQSFNMNSVFRVIVLRTSRIVLWWLMAEYMIHTMYMHSIQANETYLERLPPWALGMPPTATSLRSFSCKTVRWVYSDPCLDMKRARCRLQKGKCLQFRKHCLFKNAKVEAFTTTDITRNKTVRNPGIRFHCFCGLYRLCQLVFPD